MSTRLNGFTPAKLDLYADWWIVTHHKHVHEVALLVDTHKRACGHLRTLNMVINCFLSSDSIAHGLAVASAATGAGEGPAADS